MLIHSKIAVNIQRYLMLISLFLAEANYLIIAYHYLKNVNAHANLRELADFLC